MRRHSLITKGRVLKVIRILKFVTKRQLEEFFAGKERRVKALEQLLPELERQGSVDSLWHKGAKVYFIPRKNRKNNFNLEHELPCSEILIRYWRCRMDESEIMPERVFRGNEIVPDFGLRFSEDRGTMLLCEYSTERNFSHGGVLKGKLTRYAKRLSVIEEKTEREATVLFVIDTERQRIQEFLERMEPTLSEPINSGISGEPKYPFFFTDYETFIKVPIGKALTAKIYFWHDGKEWPLTNHE